MENEVEKLETDVQSDGKDELIQNSVTISVRDESNRGLIKGMLLGIIVGILVSMLIYLVVLLFSGKLIVNFGNRLAKDTSKENVADNNDIVLDESVLQKINTIRKLIDVNLYEYSEDVTTDNLEEGIYRGMINSLGDTYAEYYSQDEVKELMDDFEGVSYGIGCYVAIDEETGMALIYGVFEGSPAEEAGVEEGDYIELIEGESTIGKTLTEIVNQIKGPEGTQVNITFRRAGESIEKTLTRGNMIQDTTVTYGQMVDDESIGYIRIKEFSEATVEQYKEALEELKNLNVKGIILDLRNNPGGNLSAVVEVGREMLPEGLIVYTENKNGRLKEFVSDGSHELKLPLVVLVNEYSASASEILAGAIQDHQVGTLLGTTTYGKGIVQSLIEVGDGSIVKVTTSAYFTPSGRNIQGTGIEPDVTLEFDYDLAEKEGVDNQVRKAVEILQESEEYKNSSN